MNNENKTVTISEQEYASLKEENAHLARQVKYLLEQVRLGRHRQFGASSEKSEYDLNQINLFNEAEVFAESLAAEPALIEVEKHYRNKRSELPDRIPQNLPVEVVEHILPDDEQLCPACDNLLHVMGKETVRRELKLIPASAVIVEHVRYTYACRSCERNEINVPIVKSPMRSPVIKGSFAAPESIAHIMTQKFVLGVPLYRQEQDWKRQGILLSRQTMSNWLLRATEDWLEPIYDALKKRILTNEVLHADETTLQVLHESGRPAQSKSYMWLYRTSGVTNMPIVLLEYQESRKQEHPKKFLNGWSGYLHTDGYSGYHSLPSEITVVGCWAHARRKFDEALKSGSKQEQQDSGALIGKRYCDKLFAIEKQLAHLTPEEIFQKRQEQAKPVLDEFWAWLKNQERHLPKNALGKAVRYALDQWKYLERYIIDGRLEISNNRAERSIKPFVIDRKNFLFANTPRGARASAIIFSIIETAKENVLDPFEYLTSLFRELPNRTNFATEDFLPDSFTSGV